MTKVETGFGPSQIESHFEIRRDPGHQHSITLCCTRCRARGVRFTPTRKTDVLHVGLMELVYAARRHVCSPPEDAAQAVQRAFEGSS